MKQTSPAEQEGKSSVSFSVPTLLDDYCNKALFILTLSHFFFLKKIYYTTCGKDEILHKWLACHPPASDTNLLDCSCDDVIALALGSSVYFWNSETQSVVGRLDQTAASGEQPSSYCGTRSVSCVCWSGDGRILCIGTRRREIQVFRCSTARTSTCVTNLTIQFNIQDVQVPCFCLWLCSCGMSNVRWRFGAYRHSCLQSEPFLGTKTCWAGGTCHSMREPWQAVCFNQSTDKTLKTFSCP